MAQTAYELKGEDIIDSREIIEAQDELRTEVEEANDGIGPDYDLDDDEQALLDFDGEAEIGGEWSYGATLIRENEFEDYARQLAEDIGAIDSDATWPNTCIDWERAADELRVDYTSVTFLGFDYLVRA